MTRRALLSVYDKAGVVEFARGLVRRGFELLSSGGTCAALRGAGLAVSEVSDYTGSPEMMAGRVKTLHPRIHGGILARRDDEGDRAAMAEHGIEPIDLVAVNLYPFRETLAKPEAGRDEIVEKIDIGGPAMVRSAAKNHAYVAVVVDPLDYASVLAALDENDGSVPDELRRRLAQKAFAHTAAYDVAIAAWLDRERAAMPDEPVFGANFALAAQRISALRYGENPHQAAAFYGLDGASGPSLAAAKVCGGKALSYNNLLDVDAALGVVADLVRPAAAVVKHNNPCGAAVAEDLHTAFAAALAGDPKSAFGGIVAFNRRFDRATAEAMVNANTFFECVVAPHVDEDALVVLATAKWGENARVLDLGGMPEQPTPFVVRQVSGGLLVQQPDVPPTFSARTVSVRRPSEAEMVALEFAWRVCKHVKSNAIVLVQSDGGVLSVVGVGAGQMSRVDAARIAVEKAGARAKGAVLASDAFFPFADGVEVSVAAGVRALIQPGGSKRDEETIAAADRAGAAMVFTAVRHFRH
ncbi:MAG: bifunctional phosphoribosylaminoimidazolecarboxamide formyltransferase/IMP cyclohydrolase [Planctomycetota bacterium]